MDGTTGLNHGYPAWDDPEQAVPASASHPSMVPQEAQWMPMSTAQPTQQMPNYGQYTVPSFVAGQTNSNPLANQQFGNMSHLPQQPSMVPYTSLPRHLMVPQPARPVAGPSTGNSMRRVRSADSTDLIAGPHTGTTSLLAVPHVPFGMRSGSQTTPPEGFSLKYTSGHLDEGWQSSRFLTRVPPHLLQAEMPGIRRAQGVEPDTEVQILLGKSGATKVELVYNGADEAWTGFSTPVTLTHEVWLSYWKRKPRLRHSTGDPKEWLTFAAMPPFVHHVRLDDSLYASRDADSVRGVEFWTDILTRLKLDLDAAHKASSGDSSRTGGRSAEPVYSRTRPEDDVLRRGKVTRSSAHAFQKEHSSVLLLPSYFDLDGEARNAISKALDLAPVCDTMTTQEQVGSRDTNDSETLPPRAAIVVTPNLSVVGLPEHIKSKLADVLQGPQTWTTTDPKGTHTVQEIDRSYMRYIPQFASGSQ